MSSIPLGPEESQVQALADQIQDAHRPLVEKLARLLLSKGDADLFGQTEFDVRDLVHLLGAQAYDAVLAEKKTATRGPA
jgi:hypothetical protein